MPYSIQLLSIFLYSLLTYSCQDGKKKSSTNQPQLNVDTSILLSYKETKQLISTNRKRYAATYFEATEKQKQKIENEITDFWIWSISNDLSRYWAGTPWDFNGTTLTPKEGTIACGFFVATILQDMALPVKRTKLSVCAASEMMKMLVPHQKIKKLNDPDYNRFCDTLQKLGKGVYIIGLDFHVGIIVNNTNNSWFIHSNYINRQGVLKEPVQNSIALQSSKTKWLVCLTNDKDFIIRWLKASDTSPKQAWTISNKQIIPD